MKILYGIQGTGNGHIARAKELLPILTQHFDVDIIQSGTMFDLDLGYPIKYKNSGVSFKYNNKGGLDYLSTAKNIKFKEFRRDFKSLGLSSYDLVLNDFEPVSAWAARSKNVPCMAFGHQASFLSEDIPKPIIKNIFGELVLKHLAPSSGLKIGFHFKRYADFILEPVIKKEIREVKKISDKGYYIVYLPSYSASSIIKILNEFENEKFIVFDKNYSHEFAKVNNVQTRPVNNKDFTEAMIDCTGIITSGGFETPAEGLFLGKKLLVIPITGQYEQKCNSMALELDFDVLVTDKLNRLSMYEFLNKREQERILFPDNTQEIIDRIKSALP